MNRELEFTRTGSRTDYPKAENQLPSQLTVEELVSFGRFPYSRGRLRAEDWGKNPRNSGLFRTDQLKKPLHR